MENNSKNIRPYKDLSSRKISASSSISLSSLLVPLILIVVVIFPMTLIFGIRILVDGISKSASMLPAQRSNN